jgi:hypothetical protein
MAGPALANPFGLNPIADLLDAVGHAVTVGVQSLASAMFAHLTDALVATTQVGLTGWFDGTWRAMLAVAAVLAVPLALCGVLSEVAAGRPAAAVKRGVVLPLLVGPLLLAARALLGLVLAVVNGCCALVVHLGIGGPSGFATALTRMGSVLGIAPAPGLPAPTGGIATLAVALVVAGCAFVIWIELACRAALIVLLAAFIPLALAGLFWSATTRWTRRLVEAMAAVILAQLVITVTMVLAAAALSSPGQGLAGDVGQTAVGIALLLLGSLGLPMTFRIVPHVAEAAAVVGTGAVAAAKLRSGGTRLATAAAPLLAPSRLATASPPPGAGRRPPATPPPAAGAAGEPA